MKVNDGKLSSVLHSLTSIVTILKKLKQDEMAMKVEKIREELLLSIEDK